MTDTPQGAQNPAYRLTVIQLERAKARSNIISSNPFGFKPLAIPRKQPGFHFSALTSSNLGCTRGAIASTLAPTLLSALTSSNLGCTRSVCKQAYTHSFAQALTSSNLGCTRGAIASTLAPTLLSALTSSNLGCTRGAIASTLALRSFAQAFIDLYV